jgi:hypothetical protein
MKQLQKTDIDEFKAHFGERMLLPSDAAYDEVRQICSFRSEAAVTTSRAMASATTAS